MPYINIYEKNKKIKTFKTVKTFEQYVRKQQLNNGLPLQFKKCSDNSFLYSYEDMDGKEHNLKLIIAE